MAVFTHQTQLEKDETDALSAASELQLHQKRNAEDLAGSLSVDFYSQDIWLPLTTHFIYRLQNSLQMMGVRFYKCFSCSIQT